MDIDAHNRKGYNRKQLKKTEFCIVAVQRMGEKQMKIRERGVLAESEIYFTYAQRNGAADVFLPALYGAVSLRRDLCRAAPVLQQLSHPLCGAGTGVPLR